MVFERKYKFVESGSKYHKKNYRVKKSVWCKTLKTV